MVHSAIRMLIPPKRRREVLDLLSWFSERCRLEQGCIYCRIYQDLEIEPALMIEQLWELREDLERHLRSEEFHKLLQAVEMSLERPEIRFDEIARSSGIEAIEKAIGLPRGEERG